MLNTILNKAGKSIAFPCICFVLAFPYFSTGQNVQTLFDYYAYANWGEKWEYEGNVGMDILAKQNGWYEYYISNSVAVALAKWYELSMGIDLDKTIDPINDDVSEISATLEQSFIIQQYIPAIHLKKPYFSMCLEQRFLWYPEADTSDNKTRMRLKVGGKFLLNKHEMTPGTFYLPFYFEGFFNFNGEAFEHQAAKAKASVGLGYFFNERWRGEFNYKIQLARNTLTDDVTRSDILLQLVVRYYLSKR